VISEMVENAAPSPSNLLGVLLGALTILVGATTVFAELRASLNLIWGASSASAGGIVSLIRTRLLSVAMILAIGFILLASLVLNAALVAAWTYVRHVLPLHPGLLHVAEIVVSFAIVSVLFATMFKLLPDVQLRWNDVWLGGVATAVLFTIGKQAIGLYLGQSSLASMYGASGSLVVLLLWVYYSATIFFFGAEIAAAWARRFGSLRPSRLAAPTAPPAARATATA
jgi:membrane protein